MRIFVKPFVSNMLFLRRHCSKIEEKGHDLFIHPAMILKTREINELHKIAINYDEFSKITLRTFKEFVAFYIDESNDKWTNQCYW